MKVNPRRDPDNFDFTVINGGWTGTFENGKVYVEGRVDDSPIDNVTIFCDNQDRLRGHYNDVFNNIHDVNYIGERDPDYIGSRYDPENDDIPF